ncbi:MAG TPA: ABC transporter ATP-binding protein, partial [Thermomicrobiales bacterium]
YADRIVAMKAGEIVAVGPPAEVITADLLREVFAIEASIVTDPQTGLPLVLPIRAIGTAATQSAVALAPAEVRHERQLAAAVRLAS